MFQDVYADLPSLMQHYQEGKHFRIHHADRRSWATIVAPHGGYIEPGTSALAWAIARGTYNVFDFQGLIRETAMDLHITSTRFRHPLLDSLLERSLVAVSLHSMWPTEDQTIWLGGLNDRLRALALEHLNQAGFQAIDNSPKYRGRHPLNFVNIPEGKGLQLEIPRTLVEKLFHGKTFDPTRKANPGKLFTAFALSVRRVLRQFKRTTSELSSSLHP